MSTSHKFYDPGFNEPSDKELVKARITVTAYDVQNIKNFETDIWHITCDLGDGSFEKEHGKVVTFAMSKLGGNVLRSNRGTADIELYPHALMQVFEACLMAAKGSHSVRMKFQTM